MKTKITAAFAVVLLAGASTAALAQDRDRDRGQGRGPASAGQPAAPSQAAQPAAPPRPAQPAPAPQAASEPQGGRNHFGAPPAGGQSQFDRGRGEPDQGQTFQPRDFQGRDGQVQRFQGPVNGVLALPRVDGDHGVHEGGASGGERHRDGRRDDHGAGGQTDRREGHWDGRDGRNEGHGDRHWDGREDGRRDQHWDRGRGEPEHWQAGRYPPVFWAQQRYRIGAYRAPYGYYARAWAFGDILPGGWYGQNYWLNDFVDYELPYPPAGYEWVRVGGDALMIDRYTGRVVQVVRGIFW